VIEVWIDKEALAEVDVIIEMMPEDDAAKIPKQLRKFLKEKKSTTYIPNIRTDISLYRQALKEDTKTMCSLIYRNYLCTPEEKQRLEDEDSEKLSQHVSKAVENNVFISNINSKDGNMDIELEKVEENKELVEYSEQGWMKKFLKRILSCFKKC